jgi:hypothetical protein
MMLITSSTLETWWRASSMSSRVVDDGVGSAGDGDAAAAS